MPQQVPERRHDRRYPIPAGVDVRIEIVPAGSHHLLRLTEVSAAGAGFVVSRAIDGLHAGAMIPGAVIRCGQLSIHGNLQVLHATRGFDTSYTCGVQFYPRSEHDRNELIALVARLADLEKHGH
jgi:hypothetical protein